MTAPDLVLRNGRVLDPLSGLDAVADVAVSGGRIEAIGPGLSGRDSLDAGGMVVAPGFIDLHSHAHSIAGQRLQAHDGVTTALELEAGAAPAARAYAAAAAAGRPLNYGFSASWAAIRMQTLAGVPADGRIDAVLHHLGDPGWQREASAEEVRRIVAALEAEFAAGALGVGVLLGYSRGTSPDEYLAVARSARASGRPVFTHARELVEADPEVVIDGPGEIVRAAAETGAQMHYCHIHSTSRRHVERVLRLVDECRREGGRVTTEAYPYGSGATAIGAAFLAPERLGAWGVGPDAIVYLPTGERVADAGRLRQLRAEDPGGLCVIDFLREDDPSDLDLLAAGFLSPDTMVATDAMPLQAGGRPIDDTAWPPPPGTVSHPRTAGTYAKALRTYVRSGRLSVMEFVRRSSTLPALLLQDMAPAMRGKGRLQVGADADIAVFDLATVTDQATYADSVRPSTGFRHVLVNGTPLIRDGRIDLSVLPGRPVRAAG